MRKIFFAFQLYIETTKKEEKKQVSLFKLLEIHDVQLTNWFLYFSYCLINYKGETILGSKRKINHSFLFHKGKSNYNLQNQWE